MKASIIITTYNRPKFLKRAIDSCLQQDTDFAYEIIVVDDNGLGTPQQLETQQVVESYEMLRYLPLDVNSGACMARNKGVNIAQGEYIFFLDDDDEFLPDKVKIQSAFLKNNKEYDGCLAAFKRIDDKEKKEIIADANFPVVGDFRNFALHGNFFTPMLCILRSSFDKSGGFINIPRFQDRYFLMHCLLAELKFATILEPLHIMYEHEGDRITGKSVNKSLLSLEMIESLVYKNRQMFSKKDLQLFKMNEKVIRATLFYVTPGYSVKAFVAWLNIFFKTGKLKDLMMAIKSIVKNIYSK